MGGWLSVNLNYIIMPNWCYSTLEMTIKSSDLKNLERIKENGGICATYAPMPEELKEGQSPVKIVTKKEYEAQKIFNAEISDEEEWKKKKGITQEMHDELVEKYGCADWYTWQNRHWGTKWGGYDGYRNSDDECTFNSAWNTPFPAMIKLSKMYPDLVFTIKYADEDFGYNLGEYVLVEGDVVEDYSPVGGSVEAYKMAMDITGDDYVIDADYINEVYEDEGEISDYVETLLNLVYEYGKVDVYHPDLIERLKEIATADNENYEYLKRLIPSDVE